MEPSLHVAHGIFRALSLALIATLALQTARALAQDAPPPAPAVTPTTPPAIQKPTSTSCAKECHQEIWNRKVMHGPASTDCGACHVQGNPSEHKFFLVTSKEELCKKCHSLPHQGPIHKPVAEGKCMECHDPHGSSHIRSLRADPGKELCLKCHKQEFASKKFQHGPVAVGACVVCHSPHSSAQPKLLLRDAQSTCLTCHADVLAQKDSGVHMHAALEQGCTRCHDPHASDHKYQLVQQAPGLCLSCHKDKFDQMTKDAKVIHGAVQEDGGCTTCHSPHASKLPSLQRGTEPASCLKCHDKEIKTADGTTLVNMAKLLQQNPDKHGPIREGACTACHDPHAGKHFRLLSEDYPKAFYAPFQLDTFKLCFKCHIQDLVLKESAKGLTQFRDGDRNLHFVHVNQEKGRTCRACHEVHASKRPVHIREAVPFGTSGWMLEINFRKTEGGGSCAPGCHAERAYDRNSLPTIPKLSPPLSPASGTPQGTPK